MNENKFPPLPKPKFTETIRGVPCITVTEHEHLMRAYAQQARAQVQGEVCPTCGETEPYTGSCGTSNNDTKALCKKPAQATQAEVTDEQINAVALEQWGPHTGGPLAAHRAFARAILALQKNNFSHERVPMTDEQIRLEAHNADDRDWNDLRFRSSWHEGFLEGARFAEAHHNIKPKEQA